MRREARGKEAERRRRKGRKRERNEMKNKCALTCIKWVAQTKVY